MLNFLRNHQTVSHSGWTILHSHQQCTAIPIAPSGLLHLLFSLLKAFLRDTEVAHFFTSFGYLLSCHLMEVTLTIKLKMAASQPLLTILFPYLIFFHSIDHHLTYYIIFYFLFFCLPPLKCKLNEGRYFSLFFHYKEQCHVHSKCSVNICWSVLAKCDNTRARN